MYIKHFNKIFILYNEVDKLIGSIYLGQSIGRKPTTGAVGGGESAAMMAADAFRCLLAADAKCISFFAPPSALA